MAYNILVAFPLLQFLFTCNLLIATYMQGLLKKHYEPIFPLVSDSGNYMAEAATFTMHMATISHLFAIVATIRYFQLRSIISSTIFNAIIKPHMKTPLSAQVHRAHSTNPHMPLSEFEAARRSYNRYNCATYVMALIMAFTGQGIGSFRQSESLLYHALMAGIFFLIVPFYFFYQASFSKAMIGTVNTEGMYDVRKYIVATMATLGAVVIGTNLWMTHTVNDIFSDPVQRLFWKPDQPGYWLHVVNSCAEWGYIMTMGIFVYTFAEDFSRFQFYSLEGSYAFVEDDDNLEDDPFGTKLKLEEEELLQAFEARYAQSSSEEPEASSSNGKSKKGKAAKDKREKEKSAVSRNNRLLRAIRFRQQEPNDWRKHGDKCTASCRTKRFDDLSLRSIQEPSSGSSYSSKSS